MGIRACAHTAIAWALCVPLCYSEDRPKPDAFTGQPPSIDTLREELEQILEQGLGSRPSTGERGDGDSKAVNDRAKALLDSIQDRIEDRLNTMIEREFGPVPALQPESVLLEALDDRGHVIEVPFQVLARPLRSLNIPANSARAHGILATDDLGLALYDVLPASVNADAVEGYRRVYAGEAARALAAEAKLVVSFKGGEWREPLDGQAAANAIAIRGLDLDKGLRPNGNKTYDDTMYLIVDAKDSEPEVHEYRMTTESSSSEQGVGRLNSMQVVYVRGLHRGKDPAYRLKGDAADGTRTGLEGTQRILGANIHSAYAKRAIDSDTPLNPGVSLGCQVVATSKKDFEKFFVAFLDERHIKEFPYAIIEGDELATLDRALAERGKHSLLVEGIPREHGAGQ